MNYNYLTKITIMDKFTQFKDAISIEKIDDFSYKTVPSEKCVFRKNWVDLGVSKQIDECVSILAWNRDGK